MIEGVYTGGEYRPPRIIVYGPPKIGKSTLAANAPNPIFIPTEDGVDCIKVDQFKKAKTWDQLLKNLSTVITEDHQYKTVIIDTITGAADLCCEQVCKQEFNGQWGEKGFAAFGRGYAVAAEKFKRILNGCDAAMQKGMTVMLLAHTGQVNVKNPVDGDYMKFAPELHKSIWAKVQAWADVILRADYKFRVMNREKKAKDLNARVLLCQGSPSQDAGTRAGYHLPAQIELSWQAIERHIGKPEISVIDEIHNLWHVLTEQQAQDALAYAGINDKKDLIKVDPGKANLILNKLQCIAVNKEDF